MKKRPPYYEGSNMAPGLAEDEPAVDEDAAEAKFNIP